MDPKSTKLNLKETTLSQESASSSSSRRRQERNQSKSKPSFVQSLHFTMDDAKKEPYKTRTRLDIKPNETSVVQKDAFVIEITPPAQSHVRNKKRHRTTSLYNSDSALGAFHTERIRSAGRIGTKRYVDPCKVYIGNLPFSFTDDMLRQWVCTVMGLPSPMLINQCKIVYDWKTSRSKGYGFVVFTEPIHATIMIDKCDRNATVGTIDNRRLTVGQGKSKDRDQQLMLEEEQWRQRQLRKLNQTGEDNAIRQGIQRASDDRVILMEPEEIRMLKLLDPDLVEGVQVRQKLSKKRNDETFQEMKDKNTTSVTNVSFDGHQSDPTSDTTKLLQESNNVYTSDDDDEDFYDWEEIDGGELYDDSDDGVDGVWLEDDYNDDLNPIVEFLDNDEILGSNLSQKDSTIIMNREQRRNATALAKKRKPLPYKGFG